MAIRGQVYLTEAALWPLDARHGEPFTQSILFLFISGLALTYASSFQMLRGAVIIFTGLLSVAFLGKKLKLYEWLGMFIVLAGLIVVGVTDLLEDKGGLPLNNILTGKDYTIDSLSHMLVQWWHHFILLPHNTW